jgi:hypothetical protein
MGVNWEVVEGLTRTEAGRTERQYLLKRYGKIIRRQWRWVREVVEKETAKIALDTLLVARALVKRAEELFPTFAKKYDFVAKLDQREWTETLARLINRGDEDMTAIRGVIVERYIVNMKEMQALFDDMAKLAKSEGWGKPSLVSGARTLDGKELADWMIVSQHKDGRIWIMAIVESKSVSNTKDLILHGEKPVGQHLWDIWRAKKSGFKFEKVHAGGITTNSFAAESVRAGVPGSKDPTRLIAVAPRDFTPAEIKKRAVKGLPPLEHWRWPVDESQMMKMLNELKSALGT